MPEPNAFPLAMLQLAADRHCAVSAWLLHVFPKDIRGLPQLFDASGLTGALGALPCLLPFDESFRIDAEAAAKMPANRITLVVPPALAGESSLQELQAQGFGATNDILAVGVDTHERFAEKNRAGATWFAGAWYLEPLEQNGEFKAESRALMMRLLQLLETDADTQELEGVFRQDPQLSYQLLKLVNSVAMGLPTRIGSFRQAIVILGRSQLKRWLHLAMFAQQRQSGVLDPLQAAAVIRARLLELLSGSLGMSRENREQAFMVGMFSLLGVLFGMPLETIIGPLNLSEQITSALLERKGRLGLLLSVADASERAEGEALVALLAELGLSNRDFTVAQFEACRWMLDVTREVEGG